MIGTLCFVLFCVLVASAVGWAAIQGHHPYPFPSPPVARAGVAAVDEPSLKEACRLDLMDFCNSYCADVFRDDPWSDDERKAIAALQYMILFGGQAELPVAIGTQSDRLLQAALVWCLAYGHRKRVVIFLGDEWAKRDCEAGLRYLLFLPAAIRADFPDIHWLRAEDMCRTIESGLHGAGETDPETGALRRPDLLLFLDPIPPGPEDSERVCKARRIYDRICGHAWHALPPPEKQLALVTLTTRPPQSWTEAMEISAERHSEARNRRLEEAKEKIENLLATKETWPDKVEIRYRVPQ